MLDGHKFSKKGMRDKIYLPLKEAARQAKVRTATASNMPSTPLAIGGVCPCCGKDITVVVHPNGRVEATARVG